MVNRLVSHDPWGNIDPPLRVPDVHAYALETSATLSEWYVPHYIKPLDLVAVLAAAGVRSVLAGSHGMGGWRQKPRAARDTILLMAARCHNTAVRALLASYPRLLAESTETGTTLRDPDPAGVVIEVRKPVEPLLRKALLKTHKVQVGGR